MSLALGPGEAVAIRRARERFAHGDTVLSGVRPEIMASWTRCRDRYDVDPGLSVAPAADDGPSRCLDREVMLTELGGLAAAVEPELATGVVTVVDGAGRLVGAWGPRTREAAESHLAPMYAWSESSSGTNGMGTALTAGGLVAVRGPEHWCEGFHGLDCLGVPIVDPVSGVATAAVNLSAPTGALPANGPALLRGVADRMHAKLHGVTRSRTALLLDAYERARAGAEHPLLALDAAGRLVIADEHAGRLFGVPAEQPLRDPAGRVDVGGPAVRAAVARAVELAHSVDDWHGSLVLPLPGEPEGVPATLRAVLAAGHPVGFVVAVGRSEGAPLPVGTAEEPPGRAAAGVTRVVAHRDSRTVLLRPREIRAAEADGNAVWLDTDQGRLRAAERGLSRLEGELREHGFERVHRRYLVNLARVVEVGRGDGGELLLVVEGHRSDPRRGAIPVSRARAALVRARLGI